jgi:nitroreductase
LVLALRAYGFDSCMMEGFDEPLVRKILKLNDQQYPVMVIGAGERLQMVCSSRSIVLIVIYLFKKYNYSISNI